MRRSTAIVAVCVSMACAYVAQAQDYPVKPIVVLMPQQAGSASDVMVRIVGQQMAESMRQQLVMENHPGAAGQIGAERLARAAPDGYTIGAMNDGILASLPTAGDQAGADPLRSFEPIGMIAAVPYVLVVNASFRPRTLKEFIALAKARPRDINYSSGGQGGAQHVAMELFEEATGIVLTHVPYRGATQAAQDVVGGHIPVMFSGIPPVLPQIKAGKLRALGVPSEKRSALLPEVPTFSEAGAGTFVFNTWTGFYAPRGVARTIVTRLNAELIKALNDPRVRERLHGAGLEPAASTPERLDAATREGYARRKAIQAKIKN